MSKREFLGALARSGLIEATTLNELIHSLPEAIVEDPERIAETFVDRGLLTPFQAEKLLRGVWRGLMIGDYEIRGFLGKGGMGTVYLACDRRNMRLCALKVLPVSKRAKHRNILRFRREMELSQRLEHPGIAVAYDAGSWKGVDFLAMEYVEGQTLFQCIRGKGPVRPYYAVKWISEVADALDYVHQVGVVHRDLKPSNVIVRPDLRAKLLDLGLARWYDDDHNEHRVVGENRIVGSFDYIAPEQAVNSARADARSDIYGLGCLLYFCLVGHPPFHHVPESRDKLRHHQNVKPKRIQRLRSDLPPSLIELTERMMAKDPSARFPVAAEARDRLHRLTVELYTEDPPWPEVSVAATPDRGGELPSTEEPMLLETGSEDRALEAENIHGVWQRFVQMLGLR